MIIIYLFAICGYLFIQDDFLMEVKTKTLTIDHDQSNASLLNRTDLFSKWTSLSSLSLLSTSSVLRRALANREVLSFSFPVTRYHRSRCDTLSSDTIVDTQWQIHSLDDDAGSYSHLSFLSAGLSLFPGWFHQQHSAQETSRLASSIPIGRTFIDENNESGA